MCESVLCECIYEVTLHMSDSVHENVGEDYVICYVIVYKSVWHGY